MAEGRQRDTWMQTASIVAMIANVNRDPKRSKEYSWKDFFPFDAPKVSKKDAPTVPISVLKSVFVDKRMPSHYG
jgi:hypothetical protein